MKQVRFIIYTNDALALALGGFSLPIYSWKTISQKSESIMATVEKPSYKILSRTMTSLIGKTMLNKYLTIPERMKDAPRGYTWKLSEAYALFDQIDDAHMLKFVRKTIHPSYFTEAHQNEVSGKMTRFWDDACMLCAEQGFTIGNFKRSMLVLESVDDDENRASEEDLLYLLQGHLSALDNSLSHKMYDIVHRVEVKRGTYEYQPLS